MACLVSALFGSVNPKACRKPVMEKGFDLFPCDQFQANLSIFSMFQCFSVEVSQLISNSPLTFFLKWNLAKNKMKLKQSKTNSRLGKKERSLFFLECTKM